MSLLRDIQDTAIDSNINISVLLRKCKVLAARLGNKDFQNWVESELNGYKDKNSLPEYRVLKVTSKGHFFGYAKQLKNADIPMSCMPEKAREELSHSYIMQPIAAIQSLVESSSNFLQEPWYPDFLALVSQDIYQYMNCLQAWKVIPHASLMTIIDAVRNRILSFVLEIEGENPEAGESSLNSSPIPQEKVSQVFNTYISGNTQNVAIGSHDVRQSVITHDFDSLKAYLEKHGIEETDISQLQLAIEEDEKQDIKTNGIGNRVMGWLTDMFKKTAEKTRNIGIDVITKAIHNYYGL